MTAAASRPCPTRISLKCVLQQHPIRQKSRVSRKSAPQDGATKQSHKSTRLPHNSFPPTRVPQEFPEKISTGVSYKSVPQECPTRVLHQSFPQKHPTRGSSESVPKECPARVFHDKSVAREFPEPFSTRVSHKSVLQDCPTRAPRTRVFYKSVPQKTMFGRLFLRACLHLGSWAPAHLRTNLLQLMASLQC